MTKLWSSLRKVACRKILSFSPLFLLVFTGCTSLNSTGGWGEYGGRLDYLRSCYSTPKGPGESNFYIDMMGGVVKDFAYSTGLTNNHTLFVASHGKAVEDDFGLHYAFYQKTDELYPSCYSAGDLARILGPANAQQVHNLVLSACNMENMFYPRELKHYFPNATNIIHALPGTDATLMTFLDTLALNSTALAEKRIAHPNFAREHFGYSAPKAHNLYVAEIFEPGANKPARQVLAGRELLEAKRQAPSAIASRGP